MRAGTLRDKKVIEYVQKTFVAGWEVKKTYTPAWCGKAIDADDNDRPAEEAVWKGRFHTGYGYGIANAPEVVFGSNMDTFVLTPKGKIIHRLPVLWTPHEPAFRAAAAQTARR